MLQLGPQSYFNSQSVSLQTMSQQEEVRAVQVEKHFGTSCLPLSSFSGFKINWIYLNHRLCSQEAGRLPDMHFEKQKILSLFLPLVSTRFQSQPVQHRKLEENQ